MNQLLPDEKPGIMKEVVPDIALTHDRARRVLTIIVRDKDCGTESLTEISLTYAWALIEALRVRALDIHDNGSKAHGVMRCVPLAQNIYGHQPTGQQDPDKTC